MPLSATVHAAVTARLSGAPDLGTTQFEYNPPSKLLDLAAGVAAGQVSKIFVDNRTLAASATENLDLAGVLTDPLGAALTFANVKVMLFKAAAGNTNNVLVGGHASAAFLGPFADASDVISIPPGGCALFVHPGAGWTVTATTADMIKVANSAGGTGVTYDVVILG